jgi:hypothetical protein
VVWLYTLLLPTLLSGGESALLRDGPFGIGWLRPQALFGLHGLDPLTHGTLWSLAVNLACYIGIPLFTVPGLHERLQFPGPLRKLRPARLQLPSSITAPPSAVRSGARPRFSTKLRWRSLWAASTSAPVSANLAR